jgi:hypothetical protein
MIADRYHPFKGPVGTSIRRAAVVDGLGIYVTGRARYLLFAFQNDIYGSFLFASIQLVPRHLTLAPRVI